jgi:hypothetical protein
VNVGVDFESYDQLFDLMRMDAAPFNFEPLNMAIIYLVNFIGFGNQLIFFIYSILIMSGVYVFIKKFSPFKELSLLIFLTIGIYYFSTLNGIRQWAAVSMFLWVVVKALENKYVQAGFAIFLALLFHLSAIVLLLSPLLFIRWSAKNIIIALVFSFLLSDVLFYVIQNSQYDMYLNDLKFEKNGSIFFLSIYVILLLFPLIFFQYFSSGRRLQKNVVLLLNMNVASIFVLLLGALMGIDFLVLMRVNGYFQIQLIVLIPMLLEEIKNNYLKISAFYCCIVFCISYYFYTLYSNGSTYKLIPYEMYWS